MGPSSMHPANFLALLTSMATIAGAFCWHAYQKGLASSNFPKSEDGAPLQELIVESVGTGPTGTLQKQVQTLQDQNELLRKENQELRARLATELEAKIPPPKPEQLAEELSALTKSKFRTPPKFKTLPLVEIQKRIEADASSQLSDAGSIARGRAFVAMGFVSDRFDYKENIIASIANQLRTLYDAKSNEAIYQSDTDLRRSDGRDLAVSAALDALYGQKESAHHPIPLESEQDDAALALRAWLMGEKTAFRVRWALRDSRPDLTSVGVPPASLDQASAQLYFSEQFKFSVDKGKDFAEAVFAKGSESEFPNVGARPPQSTAEILHPELYLKSPPFKPVHVSFSTTTALGHAPYFNNVAGEFALDMLMRTYVSPDLAMRISTGWAGDRYLVYPGDEVHGDHVLWKTVWRTKEDAEEFFQGISRVLMKRYIIPFQPEYEQPNAFIVNDPHRKIRIRMDVEQNSVTLVNASTTSMAEALDALR